jgi:lactoylglutathione lyase
MKLAKPHLDMGLQTNNLEAMLEFWQGEVGLTLEEVLPTGGGNQQHRHALKGAVLKLNHVRDPLPAGEPSGYHALTIARDGISVAQDLVDPDGNRVRLAPPGADGVETVAVDIVVASLERARQYYEHGLQLEAVGDDGFRCGTTLLRLREDPRQPPTEQMRGVGIRYLTVQVFDADAEYAGIVERGGTGAMQPRTMGAVARFGFVRDPDGNWLEISQRASLTGPLPP